MYAHPVARFELNFSLPLVMRRGEEARKGLHPSDELLHLRVRYGMVAEGYDGLAPKARLTSFPKKRGYAAALNKVI